MWNRWIGERWPIGCQIGTRHVRLAQVREVRGVPELSVQSAEVPVGLNEDGPEYSQVLSDLMRKMLRSGKFKGRQVVSCLPNHRLMHRMMRMAPMPEAELAQAAHWKAASELGIKAESSKSDLLELGRSIEGDKTRVEVAVFAAECTRLEQHVEVLTEVGLKPIAIDSSTCAAVRALWQARISVPSEGTDMSPMPTADRQTLILELGRASAVLAISERDNIVFVRPLGEGTVFTRQILADMLNIEVSAAGRLQEYVRWHPSEENEPPGQWPFPQIDPLRARRCIADAQCMLARDLARGIALSLHYFTGTLGKPIVPNGIVIGSETLRPEAMETLSGQSGIHFSDELHLSLPSWEQAVLQVDPEGSPRSWLTAIGLSLYNQPHETAQEAA